MRNRRKPVLLTAALCLSIAGPAFLSAEEQQPSAGSWEFLRGKYYGDKDMGVVDEAHMSIEVPGNTPDPAATPLTLRFAQEAGRRPRRVRVFIDNNPSPLVATFDFADGPAIVQIDMRVRIDRFTSVRAIAEEPVLISPFRYSASGPCPQALRLKHSTTTANSRTCLFSTSLLRMFFG
jgi:sulfur-oxidizing protein SoxY